MILCVIIFVSASSPARLKMNYLVPSRHTVINSTVGHAVHLTSSGKWPEKSFFVKWVNCKLISLSLHLDKTKINPARRIAFDSLNNFRPGRISHAILSLMQRVSVWKRLYLIYAFFIVRKIIVHWVTFFFYCIVIPTSVLVPEIQLTKPIAIYIPATITLLNAVCTPRYQKTGHRNIKFHFYAFVNFIIFIP